MIWGVWRALPGPPLNGFSSGFPRLHAGGQVLKSQHQNGYEFGHGIGSLNAQQASSIGWLEIFNAG